MMFVLLNRHAAMVLHARFTPIQHFLLLLIPVNVQTLISVQIVRPLIIVYSIIIRVRMVQLAFQILLFRLMTAVVRIILEEKIVHFTTFVMISLFVEINRIVFHSLILLFLFHNILASAKQIKLVQIVQFIIFAPLNRRVLIMEFAQIFLILRLKILVILANARILQLSQVKIAALSIIVL